MVCYLKDIDRFCNMCKVHDYMLLADNFLTTNVRSFYILDGNKKPNDIFHFTVVSCNVGSIKQIGRNYGYTKNVTNENVFDIFTPPKVRENCCMLITNKAFQRNSQTHILIISCIFNFQLIACFTITGQGNFAKLSFKFQDNNTHLEIKQ